MALIVLVVTGSPAHAHGFAVNTGGTQYVARVPAYAPMPYVPLTGVPVRHPPIGAPIQTITAPQPVYVSPVVPGINAWPTYTWPASPVTVHTPVIVGNPVLPGLVTFPPVTVIGPTAIAGPQVPVISPSAPILIRPPTQVVPAYPAGGQVLIIRRTSH